MIDEKINKKLDEFSAEIKEMFAQTENIVFNVAPDAVAKMWAGLPSYYLGERFVRIIPFKDHINVEASALIDFKAQLADYKFTPKNMLQIFAGQTIPTDVLSNAFKETLAK